MIWPYLTYWKNLTKTKTMDAQLLNPTKIATKWAFINLLAQIIVTYGIQYLNLDLNSPVKYVAYIPMVGCLLLAQKEFRDEQLGGYMTFSQGFSAGFRYAVFGGLLLAVFMYVYFAILSPEVLVKALEASESQMAAKGMTSAEVDKAINISKKYGPVIGAFGVAIWYAIAGSIVGLIGAAILKNERSIYDMEEATDADSAI